MVRQISIQLTDAEFVALKEYALQHSVTKHRAMKIALRHMVKMLQMIPPDRDVKVVDDRRREDIFDLEPGDEIHLERTKER